MQKKMAVFELRFCFLLKVCTKRRIYLSCLICFSFSISVSPPTHPTCNVPSARQSKTPSSPRCILVPLCGPFPSPYLSPCDQSPLLLPHSCVTIIWIFFVSTGRLFKPPVIPKKNPKKSQGGKPPPSNPPWKTPCRSGHPPLASQPPQKETA